MQHCTSLLYALLLAHVGKAEQSSKIYFITANYAKQIVNDRIKIDPALMESFKEIIDHSKEKMKKIAEDSFKNE